MYFLFIHVFKWFLLFKRNKNDDEKKNKKRRRRKSFNFGNVRQKLSDKAHSNENESTAICYYFDCYRFSEPNPRCEKELYVV